MEKSGSLAAIETWADGSEFPAEESLIETWLLPTDTWEINAKRKSRKANEQFIGVLRIDTFSSLYIAQHQRRVQNKLANFACIGREK